jgi:hypothetical protein
VTSITIGNDQEAIMTWKRSVMALVALVWPLGTSIAPGQAVPMPPPINTQSTERDPWLCPDGYTLLFSSDRDGGDFNIYETRWDGHTWSPPQRLGALINSEYDETQPSVSADGRSLLFISFRGRFLRGPWLSRRQPDGCWGNAEFINVDAQPDTYEAVINPEGQSFCFTLVGKNEPTARLGMCVRFDVGGRFWGQPFARTGDPPANDVPRGRWRFSARNGDIYFEPTGVQDTDRTDLPECLNAVASSSLYGNSDEDYWVSEAQNLIDDLDDTSWVSKASMPVDQQWVLLALNGSSYVPGFSRIHSLRIHTGPVQPVQIEKRDKKTHRMGVEKVLPEKAGPGTCPRRLRILGGMDLDSLRELTVTDLKLDAGSPWHEILLPEPRYLRFLKIQVLETADPAAPYVAFNEVQAFGAGLSAPRPVHHVATDQNNNITIDGRPFFPIYVYYGMSSPQLAHWGFNTTLETYDLAPDSSRLAVLDRAEDLGIKVIGHVPDVETPADRKRARNQLLAARHHPALLGYLMSDEAGHSEEMMGIDERRAAFIRQHDPHHFTMLNDLYPAYYPRSSRIVDIFSIDPYPHIVGQPYSYQGSAVDAAYKAVDHKKPVLVVNASWGPIISPVENRLNVYLALIHGAKGVSWYAIGVRLDHPDHWASILRCVSEIRRLEPVLLAPATSPDSPLLTHTRIENPGARIDVMIKEVGSEVWMLAANCEPCETKARFSFGWAQAITVREVLADHPQAWSLERRDFTSMDGWPPPEDRETIRDARPIELVFAPYGVRVFRMTASGPIGPHQSLRGSGEQLAMINESLQRRTAEKVKRLREEGKTAEARRLVDQFWEQYRDRVSLDDLDAMLDTLSDDTTPEEIQATYGRLADAHPEARSWPQSVFRIIQQLAKADKKDQVRPWIDKLIRHRPDSFWRANAEAMVDPASARSGRKPWILATRLDHKPVIDGELDEPVWKNRVSFKNTVFLDPSKKPQATEFAVAYDDQAVYVAVRLVEPEIAKILKRIDKNDRNVWEDDCIVIYLDEKLEYDGYAQFVFNALGTMWDGRGHRRGSSGAGSLNADVRRKPVVKDDAWQIEIRIPFKDLKAPPPKSGQVWGLGLQRWRHVEGALYTVWGNTQGTSLDNRAETFGFLVFE